MNQNCNRCIRFKVLPIYRLDTVEGAGGPGGRGSGTNLAAFYRVLVR